MEINLRSIYKLASIKCLLFVLLTGFSCGAFSSNDDFYDQETTQLMEVNSTAVEADSVFVRFKDLKELVQDTYFLEKKRHSFNSWNTFEAKLSRLMVEPYLYPAVKVSSDQSADGLPVDTKPEEDKHKGKYIEITPNPTEFVRTSDSDNEVTFSVSYDVSDGERSINSMVLVMFYNADKLTWDGFRNDSLLGLSGGSRSPNDHNADPIRKWNYYSYGELRMIVDSPEKIKSDGDDDTNRMVALMWDKASEGKATFRDEDRKLGFVGDKQFPVKLFTTTFILKPGALAANESTNINFLRDVVLGEVNDHDFTSTSVTITNKGSPPPE